MKTSFSHVREWVFDLDYTLYPSHCDLFMQMDKRITHYVMRVTGDNFDDARKWQKHYYREHGTTLRGLMDEHGVDPHDYLDDVHDIDYSGVPSNPELGALITALPGRKHIFTNGDVAHAERTLTALGITDCFEHIFDIAGAGFVPKPEQSPYDKFLAATNVDPNYAAMFEDMSRNLEVPKLMGMRTVLVVPPKDEVSPRESWEHDGQNADHIDHVSDDLNGFVAQIIKAVN